MTLPRLGEKRLVPAHHLASLVSLLLGFAMGHMGGGPVASWTRSLSLEGIPSSLHSASTAEAKSEQGSTSTDVAKVEQDGWHDIHVYHGNREKLLAEHLPGPKKLSFSQEGQDTYILDLLHQKKDGFFVDLASNDPIRISNTFLLERDFNWNGICIEPNWKYWNGLASLRKCEVVGAVGGGPVSEPINFRIDNGVFGGIVGDHFDNKEVINKKTIQETRFTIPLADILDKFNAPTTIDFFSLDVEGAEDLIMSHFPFDKYTFLVLDIERPSEKLQRLLIDNGYVKTDKESKFGDTIWKHKSLD